MLDPALHGAVARRRRATAALVHGYEEMIDKPCPLRSSQSWMSHKQWNGSKTNECMHPNLHLHYSACWSCLPIGWPAWQKLGCGGRRGWKREMRDPSNGIRKSSLLPPVQCRSSLLYKM